jgi:hypothetical protein
MQITYTATQQNTVLTVNGEEKGMLSSLQKELTGFFTSVNTLKTTMKSRRNAAIAETAIAANTKSETAKKINLF